MRASSKLNLSREERALLRDASVAGRLLQIEEFKWFVERIEELIKSETERLITESLSSVEYHALRSRILSLREVLDIPPSVIANADGLLEGE